MSRKNNVNPNHYKVAGRGRQGEAVVNVTHGHAYAQDVVNLRGAGTRPPGANQASGQRGVSARLERLPRLRGARKIRGLTPRQLHDRRMSLRPRNDSPA